MHFLNFSTDWTHSNTAEFCALPFNKPSSDKDLSSSQRIYASNTSVHWTNLTSSFSPANTLWINQIRCSWLIQKRLHILNLVIYQAAATLWISWWNHEKTDKSKPEVRSLQNIVYHFPWNFLSPAFKPKAPNITCWPQYFCLEKAGLQMCVELYLLKHDLTMNSHFSQQVIYFQYFGLTLWWLFTPQLQVQSTQNPILICIATLK